MSIASVPEHALALLVDDLAPLHDGKVVGALRRGVGVGAHEAVLPGLAVDLLADNAGRQPLPALGLGGRMNAEALVLHRLAFLGGGLGPGRLAAAAPLSHPAHGLPPFVAFLPVDTVAHRGRASLSTRSPPPVSAWHPVLFSP